MYDIGIVFVLTLAEDIPSPESYILNKNVPQFLHFIGLQYQLVFNQYEACVRIKLPILKEYSGPVVL